MGTENKARILEYTEIEVIGCKAFSGESVTQIATEHGIERYQVYRAKEYVRKALEQRRKQLQTFDEPDCLTIRLTKQMILRIIVACMVICKGSTEDCKRFFEQVLGVSISIGKISGAIQDAALKEKDWNEQVILEHIGVGAHDEIFQGNQPICVGVEPRSTYIYLFEPERKRDGATWWYHIMRKQEEQGLKLHTSVSDSGRGLLSGTSAVCEGTLNIQGDVFHALYELGKGVRSLEKCTFKCIKAREKISKKPPKGCKNWAADIEAATVRQDKALEHLTIMETAYCWIKELREVGGYTYEERVNLMTFILQELEQFKDQRNLCKIEDRFCHVDLTKI